MRIISRRKLREFWDRHPEVRGALESWYADVKKADWGTPGDIKQTYHNASFVANNRVVFNIRGNKYRLVVAVNYQFGLVYVRFVGSHQEYNDIDAATI